VTFQFDSSTLTAFVDYDTYRRLTQGTEFQRSINLLALLNKILEDTHKAELDNMNLTPKEYKQALKKLAIFREYFLRLNPPPGIDPDALHIFCDS